MMPSGYPEMEKHMGKKIGFIGLGKMGLPMALNLCKHGFDLLVCSSKSESQQQIVEAGGGTVSSFQMMAEICDVVITIVPSDKEILSLYHGEDGILLKARPGLVCIDMTSAKGTTKQSIQRYIEQTEKNIQFIDAPVSGGVTGAAKGTLTIMAGCTAEQFESHQDILKAMGSNIIHTGSVGSGSNIKMLNQMLNAANTAIAAEVLCLSRELGVDDKTLCTVVNQSSGGSFIFEKNVPKYMMSGSHTPGFRLNLMKKDVGLFIETAQEIDGFTPVSSLVHQIYQAAANQGNGESNYTVIHKWFEENQKHS